MTPSKNSLDKLTLPWPPRTLSPNAREHWAAVANAKKKYRLEAYLLAKQSKWDFPADGPIHLDIEFIPPNKRAHDLDNCLASIKAGLDGLADGWNVNDKRFTLTIRKAERVGGMVKISRGAAP
jgi:crossover junction endodeoxyribonuclease RusA